MRRLLQRMGVLAFWVTYPALMIYLNRAPRTRAVIRCGEKIVVVKGWLSDGRWHLPGGGLHRGEDPLRGLLREVQEETGLELRASQVTKLARESYSHRGIRFPCHYFAVDLPQELPLRAQLAEIGDLAWVARQSLSPRNANPDVFRGLARLDAKNRPS